MVKLVIGLHHVSLGGDQGKLRDGGASAWASPYESRCDQGKLQSGGA